MTLGVEEVSLTAAADERLARAVAEGARAAHVTSRLREGRANRLLCDLAAAIATTEVRGTAARREGPPVRRA